ncbi:MAG: transcriptional regulator [Cyanobacteria bacterium HKST-UBA02]|nr:transcriptional regulator [Cyanobacteria bacterium HKST-UBA02]
MATSFDDSRTYEKLVRRFPLRPIRDEKHCQRAAQICDSLTDRGDSLNSAESDYLEVLSDLIAKYESRWEKDSLDLSPRELIVFLMEQNGLAQKDLVPEFGSPSRVSEFLSGERNLSLKQANRLALKFGLRVDALINQEMGL